MVLNYLIPNGCSSVRDVVRLRVLAHLIAIGVICLVPARSFADTITIIGNSTGALSTASSAFAFNVQTNTLTFTLTNTSPFDAQITSIGFDLFSGDFSGNNSTGLNGFSGTNVGAFTFIDTLPLANVPQFNDVVLDFGWITGSNFAGGAPNVGIGPGESLTFTASGASFAGFTEAGLAEDVFVRFQRVGVDGEGSDVGVAGPPAVVPEPTSLALLGGGLLAIASALRYRKSRVERSSEKA